MQRFLITVFLVVAGTTVATAGLREDADFAFLSGDFALAARLFHPLAEQGDARAQSNLGVMYYEGRGVPQDYQEALKWYRKAAEQGDEGAQSQLGLMYQKGQGVPQGLVRAHMWYNIAAAALSGDVGKMSMNSRDSVASQMTAAQIEKTQEMARRCQQLKFKECD